MSAETKQIQIKPLASIPLGALERHREGVVRLHNAVGSEGNLEPSPENPTHPHFHLAPYLFSSLQQALFSGITPKSSASLLWGAELESSQRPALDLFFALPHQIHQP